MVLCLCRAKMGMQLDSATMPVAVILFMTAHHCHWM